MSAERLPKPIGARLGSRKLDVRHLVCTTVGTACNRQGCGPDLRAAAVTISPATAAHLGAVQSPVC
jgi:hypothetical protein